MFKLMECMGLPQLDPGMNDRIINKFKINNELIDYKKVC